MDLSNYYKKNIDLDKTEIRNQITKYVYSVVEKDPIVKNVLKWNDIDFIKKKDYCICPKYAGTPTWIVFVNIDNVYYAVNFPKLSRKHQSATLFPIQLEARGSLYQGTVMEGVYFNNEGTNFLVVHEIYQLSGENQLLKTKSSRLKYAASLLKTHISTNENFVMYVSQCFEINKQGLSRLYSRLKDDRQIQEILFCPEIYGNTIYSYTVLEGDLMDKVIISDMFEIHKTAQPDVYYLHKPSGPKVGLAYLPTLADSKKCRQWFKSHNKKKLNVRCIKHNETGKWIPVNLLE